MRGPHALSAMPVHRQAVEKPSYLATEMLFRSTATLRMHVANTPMSLAMLAPPRSAQAPACQRPLRLKTAMHRSQQRQELLERVNLFLTTALMSTCRRRHGISRMSFGMIVTRRACIVHKFVSSNRPTRYASADS